MPSHRSPFFALILATALVAFFSASRPVSAHQYVVNGGFEDETVGWSLLSDGSSFDTAPDDVPPDDGAHRARVALAQPNFRVNQSIANVPPGTYRVTMSVRVESTSAIVRLDVLTDPAWAERFSPTTFTPTPGEWQHLDAQLVLPGASWVSIRLVGSGAIGDRIYIDNVAFDGAPPATMTPTYTHTPLPPTITPVPPTSTKTVRPTSTASSVPTSTPEPLDVGIASGSLSNGGFEDIYEGLPLAWSKYGGTLSVATTPVRSGVRSARLESTTESTKWLYQTVNVTGGASYAFDAWVWHNDPNIATAFLRVSWYATPDGSGEAIGTADSLSALDLPSADWRALTTGGITSPPDAQSAKLRIMLQPLSSARAALYVDDSSFGWADPSTSAAPQSLISDEAMGPSTDGSASSANIGRIIRIQRDSLAGSGSPSQSRVLINEVLYDSLEASDADGEWIELYNPGVAPVSLGGWLVSDNKTADELVDYTLAPGGYVVIVASDSLATYMQDAGVPSIQVKGNIGNSLNNEGDVVVLIDPSGRFVDTVSWGENTSALNPPVADTPSGHSIERVVSGADTDAADDFIDNERPSPGRPYANPDETVSAIESVPSKVQIVPGEAGESFSWVAWIVAAVSTGVLTAVATTRFAPVIAQRLRHQ